MQVRRVVTGHNPEGRSTVVSDARIDPMVFSPSGNHFHQLWGADETLSFPDGGTEPVYTDPLPPIGGFRVGIFTLQPNNGHGGPGMHATDSVDIDLVIQGEVILTLDDGASTVLRAGDVVVQNGTSHAWSNAGTEPAVLAVFTVGAQRRG